MAEVPRIEHLLREVAPQVLGALARRAVALDVAEDAVQDAMMAAVDQWPRDGVPSNPRGWLYSVARRRLVDYTRSEVARRRREEALVASVQLEALSRDDESFATEADDSLVLLFMCCHPSLTTPSAIALTLRAVGGLTTAEIARAFFVPEATMAQRISRAKATIKASQLPFAMPDEGQRAERLRVVMHVLYLIFNEGYVAHQGATLQRADLTAEAIRLTRMLSSQLPEESEVAGLLGLMLLTEARRDARSTATGALVPLDAQDRTRWHRGLIEEGTQLATRAMSGGRVGVFAVQSAIAALHDAAESVASTDWRQILALYGVLLQLQDNPMVRLSHAIAVAMVHGPQSGLQQLDTLEEESRAAIGFRIDAARAHLFEHLGDATKASALYLKAANGTASIPERDYLLEKAARLQTSAPT